MSPKRKPSIFDIYALPFAGLSDETARWEKEQGLLLSLASSAGSRNRWILDLACGSGFHARHLALAGCKVTGIDASPGAIAAGIQLPGGDLVDWQVGDITRKPEGEYDLALLLGNTLSLFAKRKAVEKILRQATAALTANGVLALQVLDYAFLRKHPVMAESRLELDGETAIFTKKITPTATGGIITVQLSFPDSPTHDNESEEVVLTDWQIDELRQITSPAGLTLEASYSSMDKSPYQPGEGRDVVMIWRK